MRLLQLVLVAASVACSHPAAPADPGPLPPPAPPVLFREYKLTDPAQCELARYACPSNAGFSDDTGCGCLDPRRDAASTMCTAEVDPVCAKLEDGTTKTASNLCNASLLPTVTETRPGACP